ncbi:helix-turn-helix domain-containing protein [Bacillus sp. SL00103]
MSKKGFDIEQIAHIRSLKKATIEDHIVELSIHEPSFSIEPYVSIEEQRGNSCCSQRAANK